MNWSTQSVLQASAQIDNLLEYATFENKTHAAEVKLNSLNGACYTKHNGPISVTASREIRQNYI